VVVPSRPSGLAPTGWEPPSGQWAAPTGGTDAPALAGQPATPTYQVPLPGQAPAPGPSSVMGQPTGTGRPRGTGTRELADTAPLPLVHREEYRGRRRARHRARRLTPRWVVVVGVLIVLLAAAAVPFLFADQANPADIGATAPPSATLTGVPTPTEGTVEPVATEAGIPVIVAPSATPEPSPWSLTLEAELVADSAVGGGAVKRGDVVDFIGNWRLRRSVGWLEFRGIRVPEAGAQYRLRVYYRYEAYCGCQPRRLEVWVNGTRAQTWEFTAPEPGVREITVTLGAGENTIRLTHPRSASPAIDRIEITRP
jgi:hypothetical protein